jgi:hypothetical protein
MGGERGLLLQRVATNRASIIAGFERKRVKSFSRMVMDVNGSLVKKGNEWAHLDTREPGQSPFPTTHRFHPGVVSIARVICRHPGITNVVTRKTSTHTHTHSLRKDESLNAPT